MSPYEAFHFVLRESAKQFGVKVEDILSESRHHEVCKARYVTMMVCYIELDMPLVYIGRLFHRHHSTVIHAIETVKEHEELLKSSDVVASVYKLCKT